MSLALKVLFLVLGRIWGLDAEPITEALSSPIKVVSKLSNLLTTSMGAVLHRQDVAIAGPSLPSSSRHDGQVDLIG